MTLPEAPGVFADAAEQISRAAAELWPDEPAELGEQVPSVTGYVCRFRVGSRPLYAKVSFLGVSLVSLLRGTCGDWPAVRAAQREYAARPDNLARREAGQLRVLSALGRPRVCALAGVCGAVLFTEPVGGHSLADLLRMCPGESARLLAAPFAELEQLHRADAGRRITPGAVIGERSIAGTFARKFHGSAGAAYLAGLGADVCGGRCATAAVTARLRRTVARLSEMAAPVPAIARPVLAYGDLKPEHVLFPDGPRGRPVLVDPALMSAPATVDVAKLISRIVMHLVADPPHNPAEVHRVVGSLAEVVTGRIPAAPPDARREWQRGLLSCWLMDTVNILSTYLSAPSGLPLPAHAGSVLARAEPVCVLLDDLSAHLAAGERHPAGMWQGALARVLETAS